MRFDDNPGGMLAKLRLENHLTQEELSEGICSSASLSRIENNSQVPTRRVFNLILERLAEPGFFYGDFYDTIPIEELRLKRDLIEALEYGRMEFFDEALHRYAKNYQQDSTKEEQFYRFMRLLYWRDLYTETTSFLEEAIQLMRMSHQNYRIDTDIRTMALDQVEIWIANVVAIALLETGEGEAAFFILVGLFSCLKKIRHCLPLYWKAMAAIYHNLAWCEMHLKKETVALEHAQKAVQTCCFEGGVLFFMRVLRLRLNCWLKLHNEKGWKSDLEVLRRLYLRLPKDMRSQWTFREFLSEKKGLLIF